MRMHAGRKLAGCSSQCQCLPVAMPAECPGLPVPVSLAAVACGASVLALLGRRVSGRRAPLGLPLPANPRVCRRAGAPAAGGGRAGGLPPRECRRRGCQAAGLAWRAHTRAGSCAVATGAQESRCGRGCPQLRLLPPGKALLARGFTGSFTPTRSSASPTLPSCQSASGPDAQPAVHQRASAAWSLCFLWF
jgi:hypothetical protein